MPRGQRKTVPFLLPRAQRKLNVKAIAVFNNKGGVGKTTLLCNLAGYLAIRQRLKVLVIDADPQCNASQNALGDEDIERIYEKGGDFTLWTYASPLKAGKGYANSITPLKDNKFGFHLLPGDPRMSLMEDTLSTDWVTSISGDVRGLRTTLMFAKLLEHCTDYDVVFFDMGPSLGAINRSVLLACDYFVVPASIDIFTIQALRNISSSLKDWRRRLTLGLSQVEAKDMQELEVKYVNWNLKFGGYVTQQYTFRRDASGEKRAVKAYDRVQKKLAPTVQSSILTDYESSKEPVRNYLLGSIPYFHSLVPLSQLNNKPIFELTGKDGVVGAHFAKVQEYESVIREVAENVQARCKLKPSSSSKRSVSKPAKKKISKVTKG